MNTQPMQNQYNTSIFSCAITDDDWSRLHGRVIPNPVDFEEFKLIISKGKLQDRYLAKDIRKIMQEMRDILLEHGQLREAAGFPITGRKADLSRAAAAAVRVLSREHVPAPPFPVPKELPVLDNATLSSGYWTRNRHSKHADEHNSDSNSYIAKEAQLINNVTSNLGNDLNQHSRSLPIVDHITDFPDSSPSVPHNRGDAGSVGLSTSSCLVQEIENFQAISKPDANPTHDRLEHHGERISDRLMAKNNGLTGNGVLTTSPSVSGMIPRANNPTGLFTTSLPAVELSSTEIMYLNHHSSPFFSILSIVHRFQLRYGSHSVKFQVPIHYVQAVASRQLRMHLIPFRHPHFPARWPTAKEITIYVNDQCVLASWRRTWPDRKEEVAKSFLTLDITQYMNRQYNSHQLRVDVFNKDYFAPILLVVVQLNKLEEIVSAFLERVFGESRTSQLIEHLMTTTESAPKLVALSRIALMVEQNDERVLSFYDTILYDENNERLDIQDPFVSTKCPISQMSIELPVRGMQCRHLQCVDLRSYLLSGHKGGYWNCPLCDSEMRVKDLVLDTCLWRCLLDCRERFPSHVCLSSNKPQTSLLSDAKSEEMATRASNPVVLLKQYSWYVPSSQRVHTVGNSSLLLIDHVDSLGQDGLHPQDVKTELTMEKSDGDSCGKTHLGTKRPRVLSPLSLSQQGSIDDPIVL